MLGADAPRSDSEGTEPPSDEEEGLFGCRRTRLQKLACRHPPNCLRWPWGCLDCRRDACCSGVGHCRGGYSVSLSGWIRGWSKCKTSRHRGLRLPPLQSRSLQVKDEFVGSDGQEDSGLLLQERVSRLWPARWGVAILSGLTTICRGSDALEHWLWSRQTS